MVYYTAVILRWHTYQEPVVETTATVVQEQKWIPYNVNTPVSLPYNSQTENGSLDVWIAASNWPQQYHSIIKKIIMCESGGIVGIDTNYPHVGLMQANVNIWGRVPKDPIAELNQGYEIFKKQGWQAWSCY